MAGNRCESCQKFVGIDYDDEPEEQSELTVEGTTASAEYRCVGKCAECGDEMKEATFSLEGDVEIVRPTFAPCDEPDAEDGSPACTTDVDEVNAVLPDGDAACDDLDDDVCVAPFNRGCTDVIACARAYRDAETCPACSRDYARESHEWDVGDVDVEQIDETKTTDRHGRKIKNFRYMRREVGVRITSHATCERCSATCDIELADQMGVGGFDELM